MTQQPSSYRAAGVDIDAKYRAVQDAREAIRSTYTEGVVGDVGLFGGLFDPARAGAEGQLLVASTDGVGTKVKVAQAAGMLRGVGHDLVNHCVGDILVQGARPLFFLDYIAVDRMVPEAVTEVILGLAEACRANNCALLGGETAEMPGVYRTGEMDIAGTIVGCVQREMLLDGAQIAAGDVAIALPSSGLHTNGYSLARKALFEDAGFELDARPEQLGGASVAEALLVPHRTYLPAVWPLLEQGLVHGMAHITGGGLPDNIPRILPADLSVEIERSAMPRVPIFDLIVEAGSVSRDEAYRVFNMGFGMVLFVGESDAERVLEDLAARGEAGYLVGRVVPGNRQVLLG
ncbi:MAG: phosphoribosylformylglycinamidine cyclo-ligase [Planctomycetota bacterium]|nr:phosphoribosylformylglycinamidine cyclo-ligase [Planctomycetota bacterium]MDA0933901.1 phosphoribosylformylglycinamidine cyclo-ligase [Planctomycetota bacterium]MDA1223272.1 phosphoribosylformylglycinamidine cyclo-ligase [Planctomycetota bacterium]